MVSEDLEFYHDQTGLMVGKAPFLKQAIQAEHICGKVQRSLLKTLWRSHPLKGYGAVEIGIHRFHHPNEPDKCRRCRGLGDDFGMMTTGYGKLTRVISYDHNQGLLAK